ncbi:MAG: NifU family protein [Chloroflexi bacterium]|nr:NifU family protein [Chloroflexota bacterium]
MSNLPQYTPDPEQDVPTRMKGLIEFLSAYIEQYHGGWVTYREFDKGILTVELGGACEGCALSTSTLHGWIEGTAKQFFPDLEKVIGIEATSQNEIGAD